MAKLALKVCALTFVALLLTGGGILAWKLLAGDSNENSSGFFDFLGNKNETTESATSKPSIAPTTMAVVPSVSPSQMPTEYRYPFDQCDPNNGNDCCNGLNNLCDWPVNEILYVNLFLPFGQSTASFLTTILAPQVRRSSQCNGNRGRISRSKS